MWIFWRPCFKVTDDWTVPHTRIEKHWISWQLAPMENCNIPRHHWSDLFSGQNTAWLDLTLMIWSVQVVWKVNSVQAPTSFRSPGTLFSFLRLAWSPYVLMDPDPAGRRGRSMAMANYELSGGGISLNDTSGDRCHWSVKEFLLSWQNDCYQ